MKKLFAIIALILVVALVVGCAPTITETVETTSDDAMEDKTEEVMEDKETPTPTVEDVDLEVYDSEDDLGDII